MKFLIIRCGFIISIFVTLISLSACDGTETGNAPKEAAKDKTSVPSTTSSILNQDDIVAKSQRSSYHYYFTELDRVNKVYSRRRGYFRESDAQLDPDNPVIDIQVKPKGDEIIRVYYKMIGLPSLEVSPEDMKPMLSFISMFDSSAATLFQRNFKAIFHYSSNGPDSNHYYNKAKGVSIGIDHNLDIVKAEKLSANDAYIQACILPY